MTSMQIVLISVFGPIIVLFFVAALFMLKGKGSFLIAGYNSMSKEEKARYDEKALTKFIGRIMLIISFMFLILIIGLFFSIYWIIGVFVAGIIVTSIYALVKANSTKFKIKP